MPSVHTSRPSVGGDSNHMYVSASAPTCVTLHAYTTQHQHQHHHTLPAMDDLSFPHLALCS